MNFEAYLISKKIDSAAFLSAEGELWKTWNYEFEQVHPNSFTAQKLYLINPIRRKYPLKQEPAKPVVKSELPAVQSPGETVSPAASSTPVTSKPAVPRPVFKPKPKIN